MDVAASDDVPVNLESVATTSVVGEENKKDRDENKKEEESKDPPLKKSRFDENAGRVAEIILVLSSLRSLRGGKNPTELEIELMAEAKSKLVDICQDFSPKDLISRDAIGAMIEDLGFNNKHNKEQRLGLRAPKLTISEKLSLGERKMEEWKKNPIVSSTSLGHSTSAANATGSHFIKKASSGKTRSKIEKPHIAAASSQGPSAAAAVPAGKDCGVPVHQTASLGATNASIRPFMSHQTPPAAVPAGSDCGVAVHQRSSLDASIRPFMSQTPPTIFPGQTSSSPSGNNQHDEIAMMIYKVVEPRARHNYILSSLPSKEYMSSEITCQICQETVNEVKTVLICDSCEKGYHVKCLQDHNVKIVRKCEWHCSRCVELFNGRPFRPVYGRVVRNATAPKKMSSGTAQAHLPKEKKVAKMDQKVNQDQAIMPHHETAKPTTDDSAKEQTVEAEDAAKNPLVEAEDAAKH